MAKEITDKKKSSVREGIPMTEEELADYEKVWTDMEDSIFYCYKHLIK